MIKQCQVTDAKVRRWWNKYYEEVVSQKQMPDEIQGLSDEELIHVYGGWEAFDNDQSVGGTIYYKDEEGVFGPAIVSLAQTEEFVNFENETAARIYCNLRREKGSVETLILTPVTVKLQKNDHVYQDYNYVSGYFFCIPTKELNPGDKLEFGAHGARDFRTRSTFLVPKPRYGANRQKKAK